MKKLVVCVFSALSLLVVQTAQASTSTSTGLAPSDREYARLAVGDSHSCVLLHDGTVKCWGDNTYGQLGVPTITSSKVPVSVSSFGLGRYAVELAAGKHHTCALLDDASVSCWGENNFGSLGDGSTFNPESPVTTLLNGIEVKQIFAGGFTTCVLDQSSNLHCWGLNNANQLGVYEEGFSARPISMELDDSIKSVSISEMHICVLVERMFCWGENTDGQLGDGSTQGGWPATQVSSFGLNVKALWIATGESHSCAALTIGSAKCWGNNDFGQLGDESNTGRYSPTVVSTSHLISQLSAGTSHTCGLTGTGEVLCWGLNSNGRLGNNSTNSSSTPVKAQLPPGVTARQISAGTSHTCALLDNDDVMCWGNNSKGKLGDGTTSQRLVPTKVVQLRTAPGDSVNTTSEITHNSATINSVFSTSDVSAHRSLEYGTDEFLTGDTQVIPLGYFGASRQVVAGAGHSCMVISGGRVKCWGDNTNGALGTGDESSHASPVDVQGLNGEARFVAVGASHSCAAMATGAVKCWGDNSSGQLGDTTVFSRTEPVEVNVSGVVGLALGDGFTCALKIGGTVACWGTNSHGQLGREGASSPSPIAVDVDNDHTVVSLAASSARACVVLSNATVKCWGMGMTGVASPGMFSSTVASVSVADTHACVVLHEGAVQCWGDDTYGQLGDGSVNSTGSLVSASLSNGDVVVSMSTAADSSCALLVDGSVKCWGSGATGVTGLGTTDDIDTPTVVPELMSVVQLSIADLHGCALTQDGEMWCWGSNSRQQRGTSTASIAVPEMMSSQIHATTATQLTGLVDDTSYFYRIVTVSTQGVSEGEIHTFNTTEAPVSSPIEDTPVNDPPIEIPIWQEVPAISPPAATAPQQSPVSAIEQSTATQSPATQSTVTKKRRPTLKVGSITGVRYVLQRLGFSVPKVTSNNKMWMTVLNKRVCRVYNGRLWAIRSGRCQLMVLKMSPSRRLTMSRTQIKIVGSAPRVLVSPRGS